MVASYLNASGDRELAALAVQGLRQYGVAERYRERILEFIRGVDWDMVDLAEVRPVAMSTAGEMLRVKDDEELARALIDVAEREDEEPLDRHSAVVPLPGRKE